MSNCCSCQKPKALLTCHICKDSVCKNCAQLTNRNDYPLSLNPHDYLCDQTFCIACYDREVEPLHNTYLENSEKAEEVFVFYKPQGRETRMIKRTEKPIVIADESDREMTLLKMAFATVERGLNTLVDVELDAKKVRTNGYQRSSWSGRGVPSYVNPETQSKKDKRSRSW